MSPRFMYSRTENLEGAGAGLAGADGVIGFGGGLVVAELLVFAVPALTPMD